ncbi:hypothetical protein, conserved [Trypanosoma brucei brucei TREU927]|uniref:Nucleosome assembly protein n=1 Tax=Trypanosoma brucei brucei (strain 927/4 GUTat10.1) TaxID=185431 RepID=Q4GZ00_TRYB2|nr:hypothetical protein, conserved [Trypanosoma brucei brucei TREU927]CAJ16327.1 hypothetical protein, conserved [Trypanosoma brucei brucei TREU927]
MGSPAAPYNSAVCAVQKLINKLEDEMHEAVTKVLVENNIKLNEHYSARHEVITNAIKNGKLPTTFWADAIIAVLRDAHVEEDRDGSRAAGNDAEDDDDDGNQLGTFDEALLRKHLKDMMVTYKETGSRLSLTFSPNPFFEETELWIEENQLNNEGSKNNDDDNNNNNNDSDGGGGGDFYKTYEVSDITWKPDHGPNFDDNDGDGGGGEKRSGSKRGRSNMDPTRHGWSFLNMFSKIPPHPLDDYYDDDFYDDNDDDDDDDDKKWIEEAIDIWEEDMDEREQLFRFLVREVWSDPLEAAAEKGSDNGAGTSPEKPNKHE